MVDYIAIADRRARQDWFADMTPHSQSGSKWWNVRVPWPIEECFGPLFLMNMKDRLTVGDMVSYVRFSNDKFEEFIECCKFLYIQWCDREGVVQFRPDDAIIRGPNITSVNKGERGIVVIRGDRGMFRIRIDGATQDRKWQTAQEADEDAKLIGEETGKPVRFYTKLMRVKHNQEAA